VTLEACETNSLVIATDTASVPDVALSETAGAEVETADCVELASGADEEISGAALEAPVAG